MLTSRVPKQDDYEFAREPMAHFAACPPAGILHECIMIEAPKSFRPNHWRLTTFGGGSPRLWAG